MYGAVGFASLGMGRMASHLPWYGQVLYGAFLGTLLFLMVGLYLQSTVARKADTSVR